MSAADEILADLPLDQLAAQLGTDPATAPARELTLELLAKERKARTMKLAPGWAWANRPISAAL